MTVYCLIKRVAATFALTLLTPWSETMRVFDLTLPVLLSGLATHILSTLAWMVLPHHKPEWKVLAVQDEL